MPIPRMEFVGLDPTIEELRAAGYEPTQCGYNCSNPSHYYDREGFNYLRYDRDGYDRTGMSTWGSYREDDSGDEDSDSLHSDDDSGSDLHYYSYTPPLQFRGDRAPFYGMEIEVTTDRPRCAARIAESHAGDLIYCKEDSTVDGLEMVTHPMSYDWAMANFPWKLLTALRYEADATTIAQENGIHIHVGRDGFTDSAHLFRWLKLWYRNPRDIQRIARRSSNRWGAFNPSHRESHKEHVKYGKPGYNSDNDGTLDRYSAINTVNQNTLEVRVFASTLRPRRAKAALQLVAGSVEYTRQLTAEAVTRRRGWDWPAFMAWTVKDGRYPDLIEENRTRR